MSCKVKKKKVHTKKGNLAKIPTLPSNEQIFIFRRKKILVVHLAETSFCTKMKILDTTLLKIISALFIFSGSMVKRKIACKIW